MMTINVDWFAELDEDIETELGNIIYVAIVYNREKIN